MAPPSSTGEIIFNPSLLKKHWALIPTVAICGGACIMCAAYIGYMATRKPDISYTPWKYGTTAPYQAVKPNEVRKLYNLHNIKLNPEIEALKAEVGAFKG